MFKRKPAKSEREINFLNPNLYREYQERARLQYYLYEKSCSEAVSNFKRLADSLKEGGEAFRHKDALTVWVKEKGIPPLPAETWWLVIGPIDYCCAWFYGFDHMLLLQFIMRGVCCLTDTSLGDELVGPVYILDEGEVVELRLEDSTLESRPGNFTDNIGLLVPRRALSGPDPRGVRNTLVGVRTLRDQFTTLAYKGLPPGRTCSGADITPQDFIAACWGIKSPPRLSREARVGFDGLNRFVRTYGGNEYFRNSNNFIRVISNFAEQERR